MLATCTYDVPFIVLMKNELLSDIILVSKHDNAKLSCMGKQLLHEKH